MNDVRVEYRGVGGRGRCLRAVNGVSLSLKAGETVGIIGESGSGKSSLAMAVAGMLPLADGSIAINGRSFDSMRGSARRRLRQHVQMVHQDPRSSLDPRMSVGASITEPLIIHRRLDGRPRVEAAEELLDLVDLDRQLASRRPHQLSGGQCQRVNIARALSLQPDLLVCDEVVSALDVSVQAGVLNLLLDLQERRGLAYLFIGHDLAVVGHMSDRIGVMYLGRLVELGPPSELLQSPLHPYTDALKQSEPHLLAGSAGWGHALLAGEPPNPMDPPTGCAFRTRCPIAIDACREEVPALAEVAHGHWVACHKA